MTRSLLAAVLGCILAPLAGAQCLEVTVSQAALSFGTYRPDDSQPVSTSGAIEVTCAGEIGASVAYEIWAGPGTAGSFSRRALSSGDNSLEYGLYLDAALSLVWGDGSGSSAPLSDSFNLMQPVEVRQYTVYGALFARQLVPSGLYSDSIVLTVSF